MALSSAHNPGPSTGARIGVGTLGLTRSISWRSRSASTAYSDLLASVGRLDVRVGQRRVVDDHVLQTGQHAIGACGQPDRLLHPRLVANVAELVAAPQVQLDGQAGHPGG